jgi:hypothetical protein
MSHLGRKHLDSPLVGPLHNTRSAALPLLPLQTFDFLHFADMPTVAILARRAYASLSKDVKLMLIPLSENRLSTEGLETCSKQQLQLPSWSWGSRCLVLFFRKSVFFLLLQWSSRFSNKNLAVALLSLVPYTCWKPILFVLTTNMRALLLALNTPPGPWHKFSPAAALPLPWYEIITSMFFSQK